MDNDMLSIQLRSLVIENRNKADFFEMIANLQENGYKSDQLKIDTEIQTYKDQTITQITSLTEENEALKEKIQDLQDQLDNIK